MKFNKHSKVELCVGTDERRAIHNVHLDLEAKQLVATNGRILAMIPVEPEEGDTSGPVSPEALKAARKATGRLEVAGLIANGSLALPNGQSFRRPKTEDVGEYPNYKQVIPDADRPVAFRIALDADHLWKLAQAISNGTNTFVTLAFADEFSPILVKAGGGTGVLMPARLS